MSAEQAYSAAFLDRSFSDLNPKNFGYERCLGGHTGYGMRDYYMIHFVERGRGILHRGGRAYPVGEGQLFIIGPEEDAFYVADERDPWEYVWIGFDGTLAARLLSLDSPVQEASHRPFVMLRELRERRDTREEIATAALYMIFAELFSGRTAHPHYVRRAVHAIDSLYMTSITVAGIASELGLDRRYLCRIFHERMGVSVRDYLIGVRMREARRHLADGKSVALTAELVGYPDPFNFSKMFKRHTGLAPSTYRAQGRFKENIEKSKNS